MTLPAPQVPPPVPQVALEPRPIPPDIETARQLWWGVIALNVIGSTIALIARFQLDRDRYAHQLLDDMRKSDPATQVGLSFGRWAVGFVFVGAGVVLLLFAALLLVLVWRMRAGKTWARLMLTVYGAVIFVSGIPAVFGVGSDPDWAGVATSAIAIVQAVLAGGALFLMHRRDSILYFLPPR
jgi:hypothetical protein